MRSQNKIDLIKVDDICYNEVYKNEHTLWFRDVALGIYKSKERALEVLDEIQDLLEGKIHEEHINKFDIFNGDERKVYRMPKE